MTVAYHPCTSTPHGTVHYFAGANLVCQCGKRRRRTPLDGGPPRPPLKVLPGGRS